MPQPLLQNTFELLKRLTGQGVYEIRVLGGSGKFNSVWSALHDSWNQWEDIRGRVIGANRQSNVFFTINPLMTDCKSKKQFGKLERIGSGDGITDKEVQFRRWFLIDLDPERMKGVSSTNEEKEAAWAVVEQIRAFLAKNGFHKPVVCDSGNGYHLLYRLSMPNDKDHADLLRDTLLLLDEKFSSDKVKVDKKVFNAARIVKLYGSVARKGRDDHENGRPHRKSGFIEFPELAESLINDNSLFQKLVGDVKKVEKTSSYGGNQKESIEFVRDFLEKHGVGFWEEDKQSDKYFFLKDGCVFDPQHAGKDACIIVPESGKRVYKCFHDSCEGHHWKDFVKTFEPGYKTFEERAAESEYLLEDTFGEEAKGESRGLGSTPDASKSRKKAPQRHENEKSDLRAMLETDDKGKIINSVNNVLTILRHDPKLRDLIGYDLLACDPVHMKSGRWWTDADDARVFAYIQSTYRKVTRDSFLMAMSIRFDETKFHPVTQLLDSLEWDGIPRVETSLIDYLGAEDDEYSRFVGKLMFVSAVARAYDPGIKYDTMPVLVGGQGCGKSTFCERMALREAFYSDSIRGVGGKEAIEQILGAWIVEWGEMSAMKRVKDSETVKLFLSQRKDKGRPAYGRRTVTNPRMCVFVGTSNDDVGLLNDRTGNRRFLPVLVQKGSKSLWSATVHTEFEQMMAEAKVMYLAGYTLTVPHDLQQEVEQRQNAFLLEDSRYGVLATWLKANPDLKHVCTRQIWEEAFGLDAKDMQRKDSLDLGQLLQAVPYIMKEDKKRDFGVHGPQRSWKVLRDFLPE